MTDLNGYSPPIPNPDPNLVAELTMPSGDVVRRRVMAFAENTGEAMIVGDDGTLAVLKLFRAESVRFHGLDIPAPEDGDNTDLLGSEDDDE